MTQFPGLTIINYVAARLQALFGPLLAGVDALGRRIGMQPRQSRATLLSAILLATGIGLLFVPDPQHTPQAPAAEQPATWTEHGIPTYQAPAAPPPPELRSLALMVDKALYMALTSAGADTGQLRVKASAPLAQDTEHSGLVRYQVLEAVVSMEPTELAGALSQSLAEHMAPEQERLAEVRVAHGEVLVSAAGQPLRRVLLLPPYPYQPIPDAPLHPTPMPKGEALLAVVIDDLGESQDYANKLLELPFPVTFAIWPYGSRHRQVAQAAADAGREVLVHMPMEPLGYPEHDPGPGALFTSMTDEDISATLRDNLDAVPQAVGINNHMGSRFTASGDAMRVVLAELKARGLFFLDSLTNGGSQAVNAARDVGATAFKRDVFLDNEPQVDKILINLAKAERLAMEHGQAVAIGHPYPATLEALRLWADTRNPAITLTHVMQLRPAVKETPPGETKKTASAPREP